MGMIDYVNAPNLNLGCEFGIKGYARNYINVGYYRTVFDFPITNWKEELKGGFILNEVRFYESQHCASDNMRTDNYWGIEAMYGNQSYVRGDSVTSSGITSFKVYSNQRQYIGLTANIGAIWEFFNVLVVSVNAGLGFRYNQVLNNLTQEEADSRELGDWTVPDTWIQQKGNRLIPKFNFGLKIGFRIY